MVLAAAALASPALADVVSAPVVTARTRATLLAGEAAAAPGTVLPIALRLQLKPGWHTYWRNPGDSGEPAVVTLRIDGREIKGPDSWPTPERIDIAGIVSYGHHGDVTLITSVPLPATTAAGTTVHIEAEATWLVCDKVCVPESGRFALDLRVAASPAPPGTAAPLGDPPLPTVNGFFTRTGQGWDLRLPILALGVAEGAVTEAYFFPERGDLIDHSAPQALREWAGEMGLGLTAVQLPATPPPDLHGVLAVTRQVPGGTPRTSYFSVAARPAADAR